MSDSASLPAKWTASSTESGRGEATSTKEVPVLDQQFAHPGRPGAEALLHTLEGLEEGDGVADDVGPGHLGDGAEQGLGGHAHELESGPGRLHERLEQPVLQEVGQPPRGVEEVEGIAGRGGVHHHQVEPALLHQLVELLHGHVLLGARQRPGQVPVDPVDLDVLGLLGGVRVALDQVVEGPLGVEHEGVELAGPGPVDPGGLVGEGVEAERVGQSSGRVDGDHAGPPAQPGGLEGEGGRRGGLAHPARSAADDDRPLPGHPVDGGPGPAVPVSGVTVRPGPGRGGPRPPRPGRRSARRARPARWRR